ncbi:hypothetical protein BAUCODRAFT_453410 [Baudoinia panamericana UAMH 10762]|uniref:non-specific serine/threonine protein kinase n=1 Tax=Baudoinia panamericana (strain UAMH 10762) TaxID=717646 RepID=M2N0N2_BAUPA|nr:uncharacterized protein BAUCODRAFT_453410 [Baudoinia panamericana UAMH 10762]EMC97478.1 hypothetical protein BAUCODRAFT_453410 [Baudoinia panamericana UAMH 10762]
MLLLTVNLDLAFHPCATQMATTTSEQTVDFVALARAHFQQSHNELGLLGAGVFGKVYLAQRKVANDRSSVSNAANPGDRRCRSANPLVVVKYAKDYNASSVSLKTEIKVLSALPGSHCGIAQILDCYVDGRTLWFTTPWASGGDLSNLTLHYPHAITTPAIWHICLQVTNALMYLYFGIATDTFALPGSLRPQKGWPGIAHQDLHLGNILVKPARHVHGFDIVITDFGNAMFFEPHSVKTEVPLYCIREQTSDFIYFGSFGVGELYRADERAGSPSSDLVLAGCIRDFQRMYEDEFAEDVPSRDTLHALMREFRRTAEAREMMDAAPLPADAAVYIQGAHLLQQATSGDSSD